MNYRRRSNRRRGLTALTAVLLSGVILLPAGCTVPSHTAGRLKILPRSQDADLARAVHDDPFPSAAQSGLVPVPGSPSK